MAQVTQQSTKAIKKKSLLNFRAIKNNYVVKSGPSNTTNRVMEVEESPKNMMGNSSMTNNIAASSSGRRREQEKSNR